MGGMKRAVWTRVGSRKDGCFGRWRAHVRQLDVDESLQKVVIGNGSCRPGGSRWWIRTQQPEPHGRAFAMMLSKSSTNVVSATYFDPYDARDCLV